MRLALAEAVSEATAVQRQLAAAEDEGILDKLLQCRNDITSLTDAERCEFINTVAPVIEDQRRIFRNELLRELEP